MMDKLDGPAKAAARALVGRAGRAADAVKEWEKTQPELIAILRNRRASEQGIYHLLNTNDPDHLLKVLKASEDSMRHLLPDTPPKDWDNFIPEYLPRGSAGEDVLVALTGGTLKKERTYLTSKSYRYMDVRFFDPGSLIPGAYESKVGFAKGKKTVAQIVKDRKLIDAGKIEQVEWHFFASSNTQAQTIGPSKEVLQALIDNKIPFHIHIPHI